MSERTFSLPDRLRSLLAGHNNQVDHVEKQLDQSANNLEEPPSSTLSIGREKAQTGTMPPKKANRNADTGPWSPARILNRDSPIVKYDLHAFFVKCIADWSEKYDEDEKRGIIDSFPPRYRKYEVDESGKLVCPITPKFMRDDPYIKKACEKFKDDIREGFYEKSWQREAEQAMQERREGKFDVYLQEKIQHDFGGGSNVDSDMKVEQSHSSLDNGQIEDESSDGEWNAETAKGKKRRARPVPGEKGSC